VVSPPLKTLLWLKESLYRQSDARNGRASDRESASVVVLLFAFSIRLFVAIFALPVFFVLLFVAIFALPVFFVLLSVAILAFFVSLSTFSVAIFALPAGNAPGECDCTRGTEQSECASS
jgi:hypothetical protein